MSHAGAIREARALLVLGMPIVGSNLAQAAMNVTDTIMLGWYGVAELAAVVLGATVFFTLFILGSGIAWAVMPMVAAAAANGDDTETRRVTRMGLWLSLLFCAAVMPLFWYSDPVLLLLGQDPALTPMTQDYLRITGWSIFPALIVMVLRAYLAALERTQVMLWIAAGAAVLNFLLNWALIFGNWGAPELGVRGAAFATLITNVFMLAATVAYCAWLPSLRRYALFVRLWRPDWGAFAQVFRLGWPISLTNLAESGLFSASALMMGWVGTHELAAHGIAIQIASLTFMFHMGLSSATTVRAGRAHGRADAAALRLVGRAAIAVSAAFALATVAAFLSLPEALIGLFLDDADPVAPTIVKIGTTLLALAALFQLADAAQVIALGLLRGVQDTRVPMIHAAVSYWGIGIPASYALGFPLGFGAAGIWIGLVIGLAFAGALLMWRFWTGAAAGGYAPARPA